VQVTAVIKGRAIRVDGAATGKAASASLTLPVGRHEVEVDGYPSQAVDVRKNQVHVLVFK